MGKEKEKEKLSSQSYICLSDLLMNSIPIISSYEQQRSLIFNFLFLFQTSSMYNVFYELQWFYGIYICDYSFVFICESSLYLFNNFNCNAFGYGKRWTLAYVSPLFKSDILSSCQLTPLPTGICQHYNYVWNVMIEQTWTLWLSEIIFVKTKQDCSFKSTL